jgi:glycosyltransferase involved in cell wall biosynthesis
LPKVSVCIPVYNSADTIARSITSVLSQSYQDFECVVVDDHSTDSTAEKVEAFTDARIRIVRNESNIGFILNHNECLRHAKGELIQFVHGDDWLLPQCLARLVPTFEARNVGLAFAPRHVETDDMAWKARYGQLHTALEPLLPVNSGPELVRRHVLGGADGNPIGEPTCVMVRRDVQVAVGGFRPEVPQLMDIDAWLRVLARSDAAWIHEPLSVRWHHAGSMTDLHQSPGAGLIAHMWVTSALALNTDLERSIRMRAFALWTKALMRASAALVTARNDRATRFRKLSAHIRNVGSRKSRPGVVSISTDGGTPSD